MLITRRKELPARNHSDTSTNEGSAATGKVTSVEKKTSSTTDFLFSFLFYPITSCEIFHSINQNTWHNTVCTSIIINNGQTFFNQS